jgi:hypothetical protein
VTPSHDGHTLRGWLAGNERRWTEIVAVFVRAGRELSAAHAKGLVHGDFRPDHVVVRDHGRVQVIDFGRSLRGTPDSMAPEQHLGQIVDARCDQFSYCVALRRALDGVRDVPGRVLDIVQRGLAVDPDQRFASMDALLAALTDRPARRRRIAIAAAIATAAVVGVAAVGS